jgi:hypothetical protein
MPEPRSPHPTDVLDRYDRLIATQPGLVRKGAKIPYTSLNGNMSSYLSEDETLVLRLGPEDRAAFLERFGTRFHEAYGIVQKEYVDVPSPIFDDLAAIQPWFARSVAYVGSLRPKPTTRNG